MVLQREPEKRLVVAACGAQLCKQFCRQAGVFGTTIEQFTRQGDGFVNPRDQLKVTHHGADAHRHGGVGPLAGRYIQANKAGGKRRVVQQALQRSGQQGLEPDFTTNGDRQVVQDRQNLLVRHGANLPVRRNQGRIVKQRVAMQG